MTRPTNLPGLLTRLQSEALAHASDRQLLERFAELGDEVAFAVLVDRHGPMLVGLCRRLVRDAHLADDVLQATFLVLARKAGSIRRRDSLASWLYGVGQRLARQARRAEAARTRRERQAADTRRQAPQPDPRWDDLLHALNEELQQLPERCRAPLLLCYLEGRTQDEAARQLGWSLSTLRRRLESARELLRARMTRRGATLGAGLVGSFLAPTATRAALTAGLRRAILTTVHAGGHRVALPASITVLANGGGLQMVTVAKLFLWSALTLTLGLLAGAYWPTGRATPAREAADPRQAARAEAAPGAVAKEPAVRRDRFNDPLPRGAVARLGTVAFRHGRVVWGGSLTFTPDGKHLVSAGGGWVRRWDLTTGHAGVNLGDGWRDSNVGSDLVTADGKFARICFSWRQCLEYELASGKERTYRLDFPRNTNDAHSLPQSLSPDGKTYAELNHRGALTLWNATAGTVTHHLKLPGSAFTALAFPPDGKTVVVGDEGHTFRVFDLATGKEQRSFGLLNGNVVVRMAVSPDGNWLVTAGGQKAANPPVWPHDRFLRLWDLKAGTTVRTFAFPEDWGAQSLAFTPDSRGLVAGIRGGDSGNRAAVRSWDVGSGKVGRAWTDDPTLGLTVAVSPNGKTLATLNEDGVIRLWDRDTGKERHLLEASPCGLGAVGFRLDGKTIVTLGEDCVLREWGAATGRLLGPPRPLAQKGFQPAFLAGGKFLATYFLKENDMSLARLHDPATGKLLLEQPGFALVLSPDGKRLALVEKGARIRIRAVATGKGIQPLVPPAPGPASAAPALTPLGFTPDGQAVVVLQGESVSVWDVRSGTQKSSWGLRANKLLAKPVGRPERHSWERIEAVALAPDGKTVAFGLLKDLPGKGGPRDWYGRVVLLETATGKLLHQADVADDAFAVLAFSPDGKRLAAGGAWTVHVWDVGTGKAVGQFEGHRGRVTSLAFSPDGRQLASASMDSTVLVWDVSR